MSRRLLHRPALPTAALLCATLIPPALFAQGAGGANAAGASKKPAATAPVQAKTPAKKKAAAQLRQVQIIRRSGASSYTANVRDTVERDDPTEHILVLSPKGPVIVELALFLDGKPFRHAREAIVDEMLQLADTNKDGKATWRELLTNPRSLSQRYRVNATNEAVLQSSIRRYDLNGDTLADRREVRHLVAQLGYGAAFNVRSAYSYLRGPDVKSLLDTDKDGKLSKAELAAAGERLKSRDANDNDLLEPAELGAGGASANGFQRGVRLPSRGRDVYLLGPTANLTAIYAALQSRYGNDKKEISAAAFQLDAELFKKLDADRNSRLESGEMVGLHLAKPRIRLVVTIGSDGKQKSGVLVKSVSRGLFVENGDSRSPRTSYAITIPGWKLRISVPDAQVVRYNYASYARTYLTRFDVDKNGYIDQKDVQRLGAQGRAIALQMRVWDLNGDGKVFAKEISAYYERIAAPQLSQVTLTETSQGPSLFSALDVSGDNRLSLREMRTAGTRLQMLDRNKNGLIDADEMPGETVLTFSRGRSYYQTSNFGSRTRPTGSPGATTPRGPKWFVHMDKNGDGDVTRKEFLGTKEQFDKLDTNKDGFIEPKEAEAAGKK